ncbi:MAG: bacterioferritin [candidate division Zixibacteria bacterium]|nr:bacterioferritin [candidate division Zixibacteria bacterium]
MKGNKKVIAKLNELLRDELTAINQYMVHSEMCANWGYTRLHNEIERRAITEMKHAEKHIARIIFLEGIPEVSRLNDMKIGANVEQQFKNDLKDEIGAVTSYNDGVKIAADAGDNATRDMLESILADEEDHVDWLEAQLDQITQMGIQNYLAQQVKEPSA